MGHCGHDHQGETKASASPAAGETDGACETKDVVTLDENRTHSVHLFKLYWMWITAALEV